MSAVEKIYDSWGNRASLKEPDVVLEDARVFKVWGVSITVPNDTTLPAQVAHVYNRWGASENPMPNLSFSGGEMRIPVEDFVDLILRRVPADELAEGLWADDSVRERFVYCMANRYGGGFIEDADRRSLLNQVQQAVYAKAVDDVASALENREGDLRAVSNRSRWQKVQIGHYKGLFEKYQAALYEMREAGLLDDEAMLARQKYLSSPDDLEKYIDERERNDPVVYSTVGPEWHASRDYWRKRLEEVFPAQGIEAATAGETQRGSTVGESPNPTGDAPKGDHP